MNYLSYNIAFVSLSMCPIISSAQDKPNIVVLFADDISAREFPIYGSSVWSKPEGGNTSEPEFRADTPVMEQMPVRVAGLKIVGLLLYQCRVVHK